MNFSKPQQIGSTKITILFVWLLVLLFIDRIALLFNYGFKFTGSDDMVFWQAATDYANGIFHEPFFYGQNYNFMLEALFAVPLVWLKVPHFIALPIVTSLLAIFPFIYSAAVSYKNNHRILASVFLVFPILLSPEYGMLSSMTRGFVSGLFFTSFLIHPLLNPRNPRALWIAGISASVGYIFNPNSVVFSLPVLLFLWISHLREIRFYGIMLLSILPFWGLEKWAQYFYKWHPTYNVSAMWHLDFDFQRIVNNISDLNRFFGCYMPGLWFAGWMILLFLIALIWKTFLQNHKRGIALLCGFLFILIMLGLNKVNDGMANIFLSPKRMFMALPFFTILAIFWAFKNKLNAIKIKVYYLPLLAIFTIVKIIIEPSVVAAKTREQNFGPVAVKTIANLKSECKSFADTISKYGVEIVVFVPNGEYNVPAMEFYNYGCPLLQTEFCKTTMNMYEKRTWVYESVRPTRFRTVLIVGNFIDSATEKITTYSKVLSQKPNMVLVHENNLELQKLLLKYSVKFSRNAYE